jgi:hypothetical protein
VFRVVSATQHSNDETLINAWLAKHTFWYETLPNEAFDQCYELTRPNETLPADIRSYLKVNAGRYSAISSAVTAFKFIYNTFISVFIINAIVVFSVTPIKI